MKIFKGILFATLCLSLLTLVGCAGNGNVVKNDNMEVAKIDCPTEGGPYAFTYTSDMTGRGGGISKVSGICGGKCWVTETTSSPDGRVISQKPVEVDCETKIAVAAINPDRVDTLTPSVLAAGTGIGSSLIQADAHKAGAKRQSEAMRFAAKVQAEAQMNDGPSTIFINQNDSTAVSQQTTGVEINQTATRTSGYYDPSKN